MNLALSVQNSPAGNDDKRWLREKAFKAKIKTETDRVHGSEDSAWPQVTSPRVSAYRPLRPGQDANRLPVGIVRQILNQLHVSVSGASSSARDVAPVSAEVGRTRG